LVFAWLTSLVVLSSTMFACVFAIVLVICIVDTIVVFHRMNKYAAWFMYPFLAWALCIAGITSLAFF
jgi:tryptophan-rich sensory protein